MDAAKPERGYRDLYTLSLGGAPNPPREPDDKRIREIQSLLRLIGITGQKSIRVDAKTAERLFGEPDGENDDE